MQHGCNLTMDFSPPPRCGTVDSASSTFYAFCDTTVYGNALDLVYS